MDGVGRCVLCALCGRRKERRDDEDHDVWPQHHLQQATLDRADQATQLNNNTIKIVNNNNSVDDIQISVELITSTAHFSVISDHFSILTSLASGRVVIFFLISTATGRRLCWCLGLVIVVIVVIFVVGHSFLAWRWIVNQLDQIHPLRRRGGCHRIDHCHCIINFKSSKSFERFLILLPALTC